MLKSKSVVHSLYRFRDRVPASLTESASAAPPRADLFHKLLQEGLQADPSVVPILLDRAEMALRYGSACSEMLREAQERRESFKGSPYTTVGGNFQTWDLIARALESVGSASEKVETHVDQSSNRPIDH